MKLTNDAILNSKDKLNSRPNNLPLLQIEKKQTLKVDQDLKSNHESTNDELHKTEYAFLGLMDYQKAYDLQKNLWSLAKDKKQSFIIGLEHPSTITLGRRCKKEEHVSVITGLPVVQTTRGGLATVHSEGQLVIYPIVNIKDSFLGVKQFVCKLLAVTQKTFFDFGLETFIDDKKIGLYTAKGKIAFCGLEIKEGTSLHGISINIANDILLFTDIVACGIQRQTFDKLSHYRTDVTTRQFYQQWINNYYEKNN